MATEHCFPMTTKSVTGLIESNGTYKLGVEGNLSNGIPFYSMGGYLESNVVEIGDLFKGFKNIASLVEVKENLGMYSTSTATTATLTDTGKEFTINGRIPSAGVNGFRSAPFKLNVNRYFEYKITNTNRYLLIDIVPEEHNTQLTAASALFYALNDGIKLNINYRIMLNVEENMAYIYEGDTLVKQRSFTAKDSGKMYRLALGSTSTRNHIIYVNYDRDSFEYDIPDGYYALNEYLYSLEGMTIETSTSMDNVTWEEYKPLDLSGNVQSKVGKFFKAKVEFTPFTEELTFKEYDYVGKNESGRTTLARNVDFSSNGLTSRTDIVSEVERFIMDDVVMYTVDVADDARVDRIEITLMGG